MNLKAFCVEGNETILNSIKTLDENGKKIVLVVEDEKLIGVITDGYIRRWILQNGDLQENVKCVMNMHPIYIHENEKDNAKRIFARKHIEALPVLDHNHCIRDIIFLQDLLTEADKHNDHLKDVPIVIMAGGKGSF